MRRFALPAALLLVLAACVPTPVPPTPPPTTYEARTEALHLGPAGCVASLTQNGQLVSTVTTDAGGTAAFVVTMAYGPTGPVAGTLNLGAAATCAGYQPWSASWVAATHGNQDVCSGGSDCGPNQGLVVAPLVPSYPPMASGGAVEQIKANFAGARDARGNVIFDPFLCSPDVDQADWYARKRAAGLTHIVIATNVSYPAYPYRGCDFRNDPQGFRTFVLSVLHTPGADGTGFVPIIMVSSGDDGTGDEPVTTWPALLAAISDLQDHVVVVPGWELGGGCSGWTSAQISRGLTTLHAAGFTHIAFESCPERATGASYPVESDDPWAGDEIGFWKSAGGEYADVALYETGHGSYLLDPSCVDGGDCYLSRWDDVVARLPIGGHGWRSIATSAFESVAYDYTHGTATDADVTRIATAMLGVCRAYGATCSWGNGVPPATSFAAAFRGVLRVHDDTPDTRPLPMPTARGFMQSRGGSAGHTSVTW